MKEEKKTAEAEDSDDGSWGTATDGSDGEEEEKKAEEEEETKEQLPAGKKLADDHDLEGLLNADSDDPDAAPTLPKSKKV